MLNICEIYHIYAAYMTAKLFHMYAQYMSRIRYIYVKQFHLSYMLHICDIFRIYLTYMKCSIFIYLTYMSYMAHICQNVCHIWNIYVLHICAAYMWHTCWHIFRHVWRHICNIYDRRNCLAYRCLIRTIYCAYV